MESVPVRFDRADEQRQSWIARNWLWVIPVGCGLPVVGCVVLLAVSIYIGINRIQSQEVYQKAIQLAKANPEVVAAIGEPMSEKQPTSVKFNLNGSSGSVQMTMPIEGPKGTGNIVLDAVQTQGAWSYRQLYFQSNGGEPIQLIEQPK
jgi:Cytochrome oxidase complex assembly protein 1